MVKSMEKLNAGIMADVRGRESERRASDLWPWILTILSRQARAESDVLQPTQLGLGEMST